MCQENESEVVELVKEVGDLKEEHKESERKRSKKDRKRLERDWFIFLSVFMRARALLVAYKFNWRASTVSYGSIFFILLMLVKLLYFGLWSASEQLL